MTTPLTVADRNTLTAQIATLDLQIYTLVMLVNATSYKTGSLMLAGRSDLGKDFNELITWRNNVPMPKLQLRNFLQHYCNQLIYQRRNCVTILESGEINFQDQTRIHPCTGCFRPTLQRNYFVISSSAGIIIPAPADTWICNECESIIKEASRS